MIKLLHYQGEDERGVYSQLVTPGEPGLVKTAAPLHDEVQQFIAKLEPKPDKTYALVNALGATEIWGPNINADGFSIDSLKLEPPGWRNVPPWDIEGRRRLAAHAPYGYTTFYLANAFRHHKNKPYPPHNHPKYGDVVLAVWNDLMKRVELVQELDHGLCRQAGGYDIIERLERGEYLPVSMGCRVKYDVCSICGHKSKTRADYCEHMSRKDPRYRPNMILPDGQQIFVWNPHPRFFDISYVLIGADRTAKVMALLASGKRTFVVVKPGTLSAPSAERAADLGYEKTAGAYAEALQEMVADSPKTASQQKLADIIKELPPSQAAGHAVPLLEKTEKPLPSKVLDRMAAPNDTVSSDLGTALGTAGRMGIVLTPREFQRITLVRCGNKPLADELDSAGSVFKPCMDMGECPSLSGHAPDLQELLAPLVGGRSMFGGPLKKRLTVIIRMEVPKPSAPNYADNPLLSEISRAYNGYRRALLSLLARETAQPHFGLPTDQLDPLAELFGRKPVAIEGGPLAGLFSSGPVVYLVRAHWDAGKRLGPELGERIVQSNPQLAVKLASAQPA